MRKAFICERIRTKPDYAEPRRWSCHLLKMSPKNLKAWKWTEPLLKGREGKVRPSMLVFGQCAVASLHTLQHLEEREKNENGGKCLCDRSMYKVYFCFTSLLVLFNQDSSLQCLLRGVESRGGTAVRQNNTQMSESRKQQLYEQKRWPVDDLVFIPHCNSFLFSFVYCFLYSPQPPTLAVFTSSISSPQFLFSNLQLFSVRLTQGGLWLEAMQRCAQLSVRPLPLLSYSSLACAQCFFFFFFNKTRLHLLLLQGFYRKRIKKKRLNQYFLAATLA